MFTTPRVSPLTLSVRPVLLPGPSLMKTAHKSPRTCLRVFPPHANFDIHGLEPMGDSFSFFQVEQLAEFETASLSTGKKKSTRKKKQAAGEETAKVELLAVKKKSTFTVVKSSRLCRSYRCSTTRTYCENIETTKLVFFCVISLKKTPKKLDFFYYYRAVLSATPPRTHNARRGDITAPRLEYLR